jgi:hypothetical protein
MTTRGGLRPKASEIALARSVHVCPLNTDEMFCTPRCSRVARR